MPTSFQKIEEPINDNQRSTSGRFLLGSEALTGDGSMSIGTASGHRPSTEGDKPRSRGAQKRVSWAPLMRSNPAKEEKVLRPLVTRVNTAGIIPPLPRRPTTSNLENLQGNIAEDEELEPKEPMKEPIHHEDSPLLVSRPLNLPTGWSKRPDKVPSFVRSKSPVEAPWLQQFSGRGFRVKLGPGLSVMEEEKSEGEDFLEKSVGQKGAPGSPPPHHFEAIVLDKIDPNLFLARPENLKKPHAMARAVFGGQVLGQALAAASQTVVDGLSVHSLHAYFVRAGQPAHPIIYDVRRIRDGNSFATRSVAAKQEGQWTLETHVERKPRGDMQAVY
eukprot:symbB.v1.2.023183.t1/scaffold2105.1/size89348/5